jgi:hypothetical protein
MAAGTTAVATGGTALTTATVAVMNNPVMCSALDLWIL